MSIKQMIKNCILNFRFRTRKVKIHISAVVSIGSSFEGANHLYAHSFFQGNIGYGSYIGRDSKIRGEVGRFCSIGQGVRVVTGKHPIEWVSTHPAFYSTLLQSGVSFVDRNLYDEHVYADAEKKLPILVGNDVWIGECAMIMAGVKIGDGAIIGAGSIVTKDVPPYAIVAGVPARVLRYRFTPEQINQLLEMKWWNQSIEWIRSHAAMYSQIDDFLTIM